MTIRTNIRRISVYEETTHGNYMKRMFKGRPLYLAQSCRRHLMNLHEPRELIKPKQAVLQLEYDFYRIQLRTKERQYLQTSKREHSF